MINSDPPTPDFGDDWRQHIRVELAQDWTSPWTGQTSPKGSRLNLISVVQLTKKKELSLPVGNATALLLNASARAYNTARAIREASEIDRSLKGSVSFACEADGFDYLERMIEAIVLAFTSIEAFANECIREDFTYPITRKDGEIEIAAKPEIERRVSLDEKLAVVLPGVLACSSPKGSRCWEGYKQLNRARDRLIHMKTADRQSSGPEKDTLWKVLCLTPAPHLAAKSVVDHFLKGSASLRLAPPLWHSRFPHAK